MPQKEARDVFGLAGTTLEGRFVVERPVAEGGFGVVYYAQQVALERPVAVKVLKTPPKFDDAAKQQFLSGFASEAKTIARITHPNIVQVHDYGVSDMPSGQRAAWMALEWLTGVTFETELAARRGSRGRSPADTLDVLRPALAALAVVHAAGVAHRDLKPANIMLVPGPGGTVPKLLDFGIAKIMDAEESPGSGSTQTRSGQIAFSPGYASPEQISQGRSGPWTDVHAMALILTEVLTDRPPLEGEETGMIFQQIVDRVRPTPGKFGVTVGPWEAVLSRALAVSPAERYKDATELLAALEATVVEATAAYTVSTRRAYTPEGSTPGTTAGDTLAAMSTQHASVGISDAPPPRSPVTTSSGPVTKATPTPDSLPATLRTGHAPQRAYALGGAVLLAAGVALAWRFVGTHPDVDPPARFAEPTAVLAKLPPPPPPPPLPSVEVAAPTAPMPSVSAAPSPLAAAPPASAAAPRAAASPPSATPRPKPAQAAAHPKVNCDTPFTVDSNGVQHYKPECNN